MNKNKKAKDLNVGDEVVLELNEYGYLDSISSSRLFSEGKQIFVAKIVSIKTVKYVIE